MQIQINTDNFIQGDERVIEIAEEAIRSSLRRFEDRLTRVELHLRDQNADKKGPEQIRCTVEARPRGMGPISVHHDAANIRDALKGASRKARDRLSGDFDKLDDARRV